MRRALLLSSLLALGALRALVACNSFDEATTTSSADASSDAGPGEAEGGCRSVLDETFGAGLGQLPNVFTDDAGTLTVENGELVATLRRPANSEEAQAEHTERPRGTERRYRVRFVVRGVRAGEVADRVRVGCTLKLIDRLSACNVFAMVDGTALRAVTSCTTGDTSGRSLMTLASSTPDELPMTLEVAYDEAGRFKPTFTTGTGLTAELDPVPFPSTTWQIKCGIDDGTLTTSGTAGAYTVRVDDVHVERCDR